MYEILSISFLSPWNQCSAYDWWWIGCCTGIVWLLVVVWHSPRGLFSIILFSIIGLGGHRQFWLSPFLSELSWRSEIHRIAIQVCKMYIGFRVALSYLGLIIPRGKWKAVKCGIIMHTNDFFFLSKTIQSIMLMFRVSIVSF